MHGRGGAGSVYVFAAGNGKSTDNCNYDGYANGLFSLTIGAIDTNNAMPAYMEPCAAQLAVTYSSGADRKIVTTDLGGDSCTSKHGGTSAAAPLAAGLFALALQARPELTWRDLQHVIVESAQPVASLDSSWQRNGAGRLYSQKFGFGRLDADRLVTCAQAWALVGPPAVLGLPLRATDRPIPAGSTAGLSDTALVRGRGAALARLEHVTVAVHITHPSRGRLQLFLRSPAGTVAQLATRRPLDTSADGLRGWTFMTPAFWGEPVDGPWTLNVVDKTGTADSGRLLQWRLSFWGEQGAAAAYDPAAYAAAFLAAYYPPSPDHFADTAGLWPDLRPAVACGAGSAAAYAPQALLLCAALYAAFRLLARLARRHYLPVSSNTALRT